MHGARDRPEKRCVVDDGCGVEVLFHVVYGSFSAVMCGGISLYLQSACFLPTDLPGTSSVRPSCLSLIVTLTLTLYPPPTVPTSFPPPATHLTATPRISQAVSHFLFPHQPDKLIFRARRGGVKPNKRRFVLLSTCARMYVNDGCRVDSASLPTYLTYPPDTCYMQLSYC
ncbi:uncharacterized protein J3D65DRAFT_175273 [Phyllosticta citribraziliensis]|uniref:Uncharacterized protein n=1 Tax=Phyllosticta citribraziliensis TaxID=989973 RepID=A0ABR1L1T3_9PEZI